MSNRSRITRQSSRLNSFPKNVRLTSQTAEWIFSFDWISFPQKTLISSLLTAKSSLIRCIIWENHRQICHWLPSIHSGICICFHDSRTCTHRVNWRISWTICTAANFIGELIVVESANQFFFFNFLFLSSVNSITVQRRMTRRITTTTTLYRKLFHRPNQRSKNWLHQTSATRYYEMNCNFHFVFFPSEFFETISILFWFWVRFKFSLHPSGSIWTIFFFF